MEFNYKDVGLRIKMIRLKNHLTQDQVAELTGLSSVHISNVETANTKVGLQSLVKIANVLDSSVDEILYDNLVNKRHIVERDMIDVISDCDPKELRVIADTAMALKESMRLSFTRSPV